MKEIQKILLIQFISAALGEEPSYISALPRSKICGESSSAATPYGVINDDLTSLAGDGDACIYRIKNEKSNQIRLVFRFSWQLPNHIKF